MRASCSHAKTRLPSVKAERWGVETPLSKLGPRDSEAGWHARSQGLLKRALSWDDIRHYQKIIKILAETDRIMRGIEMLLGESAAQ